MQTGIHLCGVLRWGGGVVEVMWLGREGFVELMWLGRQGFFLRFCG